MAVAASQEEYLDLSAAVKAPVLQYQLLSSQCEFQIRSAPLVNMMEPALTMVVAVEPASLQSDHFGL
jgi:hypothetical protein